MAWALDPGCDDKWSMQFIAAMAWALQAPAAPVAWAPQSPAARAAMFARISASRAPGTALSAACGGAGAHTLLSPPPVQHALLGFFTTANVLPLRAACREARAAVAGHGWEDRGAVIKGSIAAWRACFPRARCANVRGWDESGRAVRRSPLLDADFVHLEGLRELNMAGCTAVTDAAFAHLRGIRTLDMSFCRQCTITDAAFAHLVGIQRLSIWGCEQATLTDAALAHLRGIQLLNMGDTRQFTDAAFEHLRGIHTLIMWYCQQPAISDAALAHLAGIHTLVIECCDQVTLTGAGFVHLRGISALGMFRSRPDLVAAARGLGLPVNVRDCTSYGGLHYTFDERGWDDMVGE
jgi:hypothetical protein